MGWTYKRAHNFLKNGKVDKKAEISALLDDFRDCNRGTAILKSRVVRDVVYMAITDFDCIYAAVVYVDVDDERGEIGYKFEPETVCPCAQNCPSGILDILTPADDKFSIAWRTACRQNLPPRLVKSKFFICATDRDGRKGAHQVQGYTACVAGHTFGLHSFGGEWIATDLYSGLKLFSQKTRKKAVEYCVFAMRRDEVRRVLGGAEKLALDYVF